MWSSRNIAWTSMDAVGASGGIAILWKESSSNVLEVVECIHTLSIHLSLVDGFTYQIIEVYGPSCSTDTKYLWKELYDLDALFHPNWILGGDFDIFFGKETISLIA